MKVIVMNDSTYKLLENLFNSLIYGDYVQIDNKKLHKLLRYICYNTTSYSERDLNYEGE